MKRMVEGKGSGESLLALNVQGKQEVGLFHKRPLGEIWGTDMYK